jgi:hypothetical protein
VAAVSSFLRRWATVVGLVLLGCSGTGTDPGDSEQVGSISQANTVQSCATPPLSGECRYLPAQASASSVEGNNSAYDPEIVNARETHSGMSLVT